MGAHSYTSGGGFACTAQQYIRTDRAGIAARGQVRAYDLGDYRPSEPSLWERRVAELRFAMETHGASVVVSVQGELDVTSSQRFDDFLSEAAAASDRVILDMSKVDFMDTTALAGTGSGAANGPGASEPGELGKPEATAG